MQMEGKLDGLAVPTFVTFFTIGADEAFSPAISIIACACLGHKKIGKKVRQKEIYKLKIKSQKTHTHKMNEKELMTSEKRIKKLLCMYPSVGLKKG